MGKFIIPNTFQNYDAIMSHPMLRRDNHCELEYHIRWKNFRCFEDTGSIEIKPITILIGANNSGKSSVFAPLLMLKQTIENNDPNIPLIGRGKYINLGNFKDYIHVHNDNLILEFSIDFHKHILDGDEKKTKVGELAPSSLLVSFIKDKSFREIKIDKYIIFDALKRQLFSKKIQKNDMYNFTFHKSFGRSRIGRVIKKAIRLEEPTHFYYDAKSVSLKFFQHNIKYKTVGFTERHFELSEAFREYLNTNDFIVNVLRDYLRNISYIGPWRDPPQRIYEIPIGITPECIGISGEYLIQTLIKIIERKELYKIHHWIRKFEIGQRIHCRKYSLSNSPTDMYSIELTSMDKSIKHNYVDCGFGVSQLLPIIVQGIFSLPNSMHIIEQPEIHLNPKQQLMLGDFFSEMIKQHKYFVLETHSEHLLLRLRSLIASKKISNDSIALYFVERKDNKSSIRRIPIRDDGHIDMDKWPIDFFGENLDESIRLASAQLRKK